MKIQTLEIGNIGTNCYVISDDQGTCAIIDCDGNPQPKTHPHSADPRS